MTFEGIQLQGAQNIMEKFNVSLFIVKFAPLKAINFNMWHFTFDRV